MGAEQPAEHAENYTLIFINDGFKGLVIAFLKSKHPLNAEVRMRAEITHLMRRTWTRFSRPRACGYDF